MGKSAAYYTERAQAREAAYKYVNNPYPEGSRQARFFEKAKQHKASTDAHFDDMEEIYGTIGTKKPVIDNVPNSFSPKAKPQEIEHA
ncbi:hypothetical protein [Mesorhizobium sp. SP-1A]|uniref:hypothetical protein n=1 Tax=Mesorhizobium sp. SP-1A TaxID=3077840 RepID=UPI0028F6D6AE|nr:hypothetical protein [Mesorhizobium sp. SP-1A]